MKNLLIVSLLVLVQMTLLMGQEKKIVIQTEIDGDMIEDEILLNLPHIEFADSNADAMVFIKKMPEHMPRVSRVIVKETGFLKKNKVIIDFDVHSQTILKVVDNGKEVDPKKFHKYQEHLEGATELSELEALVPRMEEIELKIELADLDDSLKLINLDSILIDLEGLKSEHALLSRERLISMKKVIELETLTEDIQETLESAGMTPPQKIESISIKDRKFFLNGEEIKGDVGKKCIQIYTDLSGVELDHDSENKWMDKDIQIEIRLD